MTFVFLHVDRTGGMAVRELLARQFGEKDIRPVPHDVRAGVDTSAYPIDRDFDLIRQNQGFTHQVHELVMGHWDWGVVERISGPVRVMTVLRDPVDRAASLWRYVVQERAMYGGLSIQAEALGCRAWLERHVDLWANVMLKQLAGIRWSDPQAIRGCDIQNAVDRVATARYVGVTAYLTEFMDTVCQCEGWAGIVRRMNSTSPQTELVGELREYIYERASFDVWLYEMAKWRCERTVQPRVVAR